MSKTTDITITAETPATLADKYLRIQAVVDKADASSKWGWARDVSAMLDCTPDKKTKTAACEEVGLIVGRALKGTPYSVTWVRQHVLAYGKFPVCPATSEEHRAFLSAVNGNGSRAAKATETKAEPAAETEQTEVGAKDFIGDVRKAIARALKAGMTAEEIKAGIEDLI